MAGSPKAPIEEKKSQVGTYFSTSGHITLHPCDDPWDILCITASS